MRLWWQQTRSDSADDVSGRGGVGRRAAVVELDHITADLARARAAAGEGKEEAALADAGEPSRPRADPAPMTEASVEHPWRVLPFRDPSRRRRLVKVAGWLAGIAAVVLLLHLAGIDVVEWFQDLWQQIKAVPPGYIVAALLAQTGQTVLAGRLVLRHPQRRVSGRGHARADRRPPMRSAWP